MSQDVGSSASVTLRLLSEAQIGRIHQATLDLLARTGVSFQHEEALRILRKAGATADGDRVRIGEKLVQRAIDSAPPAVNLYDRDGEPAMALTGRNTCFGTGSDTPTTVDLHSGQVRKTGKPDTLNLARLVDALPNVDFVMSMGISSEYGEASFCHQFDAMLRGTRKPNCYTAQGTRDMEAILEMMIALRGDERAVQQRPPALLYAEPIPPLQNTDVGCEMLIFCGRHRLPVTYPTGSMCGGNAPVTIEAGLVQANAECLSGLVLHQLVGPGAPFVYGGNIAAMDMQTGTYSYGSPEFQMGYAATADLGHHYGLPIWGLTGASDSKVLDAQAGAEASFQILMAILSGQNLVHDVGYLAGGLTSSMEMICFCDELIAMHRRIGRGYEITDETLALDVLDEVGPGGHFLDHDHTLEHFREALFLPKLIARRPPQRWREQGSKDLFVRAHEMAVEIMADHQVEPLPAGVSRRIEQVLEARAQ
jgi:trimethylamine--corrinoid protein Co-methyltransferase